jgi:hypothetical protein
VKRGGATTGVGPVRCESWPKAPLRGVSVYREKDSSVEFREPERKREGPAHQASKGAGKRV